MIKTTERGLWKGVKLGCYVTSIFAIQNERPRRTAKGTKI